MRIGTGLTASRVPVSRVSTTNCAGIEQILLAVVAYVPDVQERTTYGGHAPVNEVVRNILDGAVAVLRHENDTKVGLQLLR